jgi:hypothetical protein
MPKADVTYNTIGFVGTVGTGATFTLYLDDEKTGAKTYHVYFKQLGGTGKLTLTTGVSGATNLTLNAGTYVAIIYVDENGNITNTASTPTSTIEAGNTQPATSGGVSTQITNTISGLSVSSVGGSGKYIEAISETNGKISATVQNIANEVTANNMQSVTSNAVAISNSFTTTEQKTGGTWTDGKPIYRKVIDFGALPNAGDKSVNHNISNLNKMISIKGTSANGIQVFPIPFVNPSGIQYQIAIFTTVTQITIRTGYDRRDFTNTRIILEYTKTTD